MQWQRICPLSLSSVRAPRFIPLFSFVRYLRTLTKRFLPSSFLHTWRDLQHTDLPHPETGEDGSPRINIVKSHYFPRRTIYFLPDQPLPGTVSYEEGGAYRGAVAYKLCRLLGYGIRTNAPHRYETAPPSNYDVAFKYERATYLSPLPDHQSESSHVINGTCSDVSKQAVNAAFEDVFGYALGVDPSTYEGAMVVKSNLNAAHDGHIIQGPLSPSEVEPGNAYQKVIDNTVDGEDAVVDYRLPIHGEQIPLVYLKYRPTSTRFKSNSTYTTLHSPTDVFSGEELDQILQMADRMGIDFGEFDVLRDNEEGRIYVVDVNPTPWGPPRGLSESKREQALLQLQHSFEHLIDSY